MEILHIRLHYNMLPCSNYASIPPFQQLLEVSWPQEQVTEIVWQVQSSKAWSHASLDVA